MKKLEGYDQTLLKLTILVVALGMATLFSAGFARALSVFNDMTHDVKSQGMWVVIGFVAMWAMSRYPFLNWHKYAGLLMGVSLILCFLVMIPGIGIEMGGARRWLPLPIPGMRANLQPAEPAKLAVVLFLAAYFSERFKRAQKPSRPRQETFSTLFPWVKPLVLVVATIALIEHEPDMGTAMIVGAIAMGMMVVGNVKARWIALCLCIVGVVGVAMVQKQGYRTQRLAVWANPWEQYKDKGYQPARGMLAVGSGGLTGVGPGEGREKRYLPAATTDYVFATVAEETGFIGSVFFMGVMLWIVQRCFAIGAMSKSPFGAMTCFGIGVWIGFQSLMNLGVVTGALPSIGVPLPFVSYGGSSLCVLLISLGIVQNVARNRQTTEVSVRNEVRNHGRRDGWTHDARVEHRVSRAASGR